MDVEEFYTIFQRTIFTKRNNISMDITTVEKYQEPTLDDVDGIEGLIDQQTLDLIMEQASITTPEKEPDAIQKPKIGNPRKPSKKKKLHHARIKKLQ